MCGIVGMVGEAPAAPALLDALRRLEYRGYDSAGIATVLNGRIDRRRAEGKLTNLAGLLDRQPLAGTTGIGHTRWATHGAPTENNAHPHATARVAVVHNGIIENHQAIRDRLAAAGCAFSTETDTEVVAHLVDHYLDAGNGPVAAFARALGELEGAFALAVVIAGESGLMLGARRGAPLAVGYGDGAMYLGSDAMALAPMTRRIAYLEEGDWAEVRPAGAVIHDAAGTRVERPVRETAYSGALMGKGNFRHFMEKEIHEQPAAIGDTLRSLVNPADRSIALPALPFDLAQVGRAALIACGTSWHAALVARYWFETIAGLPAETDVGSEFRYRGALVGPDHLAVMISQSGETADTLAALRYARDKRARTLAIVNVPESTMAREAEAVLATHAGPEIGVASTKAFTTQLAVLAALAIATARARGAIDAAEESNLVAALTEAPAHIAGVLEHDERLRAVADRLQRARDVLYLGRGPGWPMALEGALKLKEISYIHAEGYAAGEMKHGPIALIDEHVPVIVVAPSDAWFEKTASNVQEVAARGGQVILLSDRAGLARIGHLAAETIELPAVPSVVAPIVYAVPVQLLAYHTAVLKGTDVDQPRNLAKSVTVE